MSPPLSRYSPPGFSLHTPLRGPCDLRVVVGHVGERLVKEALREAGYAVEPWRAADIPVAVDGNSTSYVRPDLWLPSETAIVEVKAALRGRRYYVMQEQLDLYGRIHLASAWPAPRPAVYYAFISFAHPYAACEAARVAAEEKGRRLKRPYEVGEVVAALLQSTSKPILVAFPVVAAWARQWGTTGRSWSGPLSPMLGDYAAYYRFTVEKVEAALRAPHFNAGKAGQVAVRRDTPSARVLTYPRPPRPFQGVLPTATVELF